VSDPLLEDLIFLVLELEITIEDLVALKDPARLIEWCMNVGVLSSTYVCPQCGKNMKLSKTDKLSDKYTWRCRRDDHDLRRSVRKGTWFEECRLSMYQILIITYYWVIGRPAKHIALDRNISPTTVGEWKNFCRDVCVWICARENEMIGGEGVIVEIEESEFGKRKFSNRSRRVNTTWVIGGVERCTHKCFMAFVKERTKEGLLEVIQKYIRPGSIIISDCWRSYYGLKSEGYHHTYQFRNPDTRDQAKSAEGTWSMVKKSLKGTPSQEKMLNSYLAEYVWRQKRKGQEPHLMHLFLQDVLLLYPPRTQD
jgi:transposase-like protein